MIFLIGHKNVAQLSFEKFFENRSWDFFMGNLLNKSILEYGKFIYKKRRIERLFIDLTINYKDTKI